MPRVYTYGPFQSRRLGLSLGINVLPNYKLCTFNCVYCEIGITERDNLVSSDFRIKLPPLPSFRKELISILTHVPHLDSITFGYNGEPTLNENLLDFYMIALEVRSRLDWTKKKPKLTIFTNSSTLHYDTIAEKVKQFEVVLAKLDVGTKEDFNRTNRPHKNSPSIQTVINALAKLKQLMPKDHKLTIQTLVYNSYRDDVTPNNNNENVKALAQAIKKIKPDFVQIYSTARIPAEYYVYSIDDNRKNEIVKNLESFIQDENIKIHFY
ncbi:MAG: radical SAM protein [Promethearchaeota archaeon]|jgi:wyosine [tRNA(Phe)-imidazoG37] synthetase (radical SAM superfamily)